MITDVHITRNGILSYIKRSLERHGEFIMFEFRSNNPYHIYTTLVISDTLGLSSKGMDDICIFLENILKDHKECNKIYGYDLDFYQTVAITITHETMHKVIEKEHGMLASCKYDNIYRKLRKNGVKA